ncbi:hypothetical protein B0H17DRAFT_1077138 [Mycena rosella]|uniref:Secreted protein n=1 Tax=Mycena rosella TaxID=1033263 RepID=A0AAD7G993_MYCRO|nr:hypothetical protein B0H17DRAFT_1077138 [Mycena rosella]
MLIPVHIGSSFLLLCWAWHGPSRCPSGSSSGQPFVGSMTRSGILGSPDVGLLPIFLLPHLTREDGRRAFLRAGVGSGSLILRVHKPARGPIGRALLSPKMARPNWGGHQFPYCQRWQPALLSRLDPISPSRHTRRRATRAQCRRKEQLTAVL